MLITLTEEKALKLKQACLSLMNSKHRINIREVAQVLGLIVSSFPGVEYGPLYYRNLEGNKSDALKANKGNFDAPISLTPKAIEELIWWAGNVVVANKAITGDPPDYLLTTDASMTGWGAVLNDIKTGGVWLSEERLNHINLLEIKAVFLGLKSL